jgi:hypothetical protein
MQTSSLTAFVNLDHFFLATNPSMIDLYGGDNTSFGERGFSFAAQIDGKLSGPEATRSGVMYRGKVSFDSFRNSLTLQ